MTCSHFPAATMVRYAPLACAECGGWIDAEGKVMDRHTTLARYPGAAAVVATEDPLMPTGSCIRAGRWS